MRALAVSMLVVVMVVQVPPVLLMMLHGQLQDQLAPPFSPPAARSRRCADRRGCRAHQNRAVRSASGGNCRRSVGRDFVVVSSSAGGTNHEPRQPASALQQPCAEVLGRRAYLGAAVLSAGRKKSAPLPSHRAARSSLEARSQASRAPVAAWLAALWRGLSCAVAASRARSASLCQRAGARLARRGGGGRTAERGGRARGGFGVGAGWAQLGKRQ
jgi:hypothetical protein